MLIFYNYIQSCAKKESYLTTDQIFNLTELSTECSLTNGYISCKAYRGFNLARPRWWFIVLDRCFPNNQQYNVKHILVYLKEDLNF